MWRCGLGKISVRADALYSKASALTPLTLTLSRKRERGAAKRVAFRDGSYRSGAKCDSLAPPEIVAAP